MEKKEFIIIMEIIKKHSKMDYSFLSTDLQDKLWEPMEELVKMLNISLDLDTTDTYGTAIDWWIWETNFGEKNYTVEYDNGDKFDILTIEDLWDDIHRWK